MRSCSEIVNTDSPTLLRKFNSAELVMRVKLLMAEFPDWNKVTLPQGNSITIKEIKRRRNSKAILAQLILLGWINPEDLKKYETPPSKSV